MIRNQPEILTADCLDALRDVEPGTVRRAYLDPPFYSGREHRLTNRSGTETYSFEDRWTSVASYINFMVERLTAVRETLAEDGSIFVHCDTSANHLLRTALDKTFGADQFRAEIIWSYRRWSNGTRSLTPAHQTIYFYSKTGSYKFNSRFGEYSPTTNVDQLVNLRQRSATGKTTYAVDSDGGHRLATEKKGVPMSDVWEIPYLNPKAKERVGYPTQKPVLLLERIIELVTDVDDIVLDPFCGSGTTLVAATLLGRRSIGIDINPAATALTRSRLEQPFRTGSVVAEKGREGFLKADEWAISHLAGLKVTPVHRNRGIDAFVDLQTNAELLPVRVQRFGESLVEAIKSLHAAGAGTKYSRGVIVRTHGHLEGLLAAPTPAWVLLIDSLSMQLEIEDSVGHRQLG
jgi:site-specific DNA-methyltransferase (adenine-specific)